MTSVYEAVVAVPVGDEAAGPGRRAGRGWAAFAAVVVLLSTVLALGAWSAGRGQAVVVGPGSATVHLVIEHSRFDHQRIAVRPGTTVTFVVENRDPINHELIVGDEGVHARHRSGNEPAHPPVPGEVTVGPGQTATTTYRFDQRGPVRFACHLPGHLEYGMEGVVVVAG